MYSSVTEGDLILWLIHYYLTLRITKSQTNLLLGFTWKHRHLLWYDTPPADSMPSKFFPPWPATCRFCEPSENSTTCSFSTKACHLQFLKSRPPADYFAFSNFSTKACHLQFWKLRHLRILCHLQLRKWGNLFVCSRESLQLASWCNNIIQYPALHFKCNCCDQIPSNCASGNMQI